MAFLTIQLMFKTSVIFLLGMVCYTVVDKSKDNETLQVMGVGYISLFNICFIQAKTILMKFEPNEIDLALFSAC